MLWDPRRGSAPLFIQKEDPNALPIVRHAPGVVFVNGDGFSLAYQSFHGEHGRGQQNQQAD